MLPSLGLEITQYEDGIRCPWEQNQSLLVNNFFAVDEKHTEKNVRFLSILSRP